MKGYIVFEILELSILHRPGQTDLVTMKVSHPSAIYGEANMTLHFEAMRGGGAAYCATHFPGIKYTEH